MNQDRPLPQPTLIDGLASAEDVHMIARGLELSGMAVALFAPDDTLTLMSPAFVKLWDVQPMARTFADVLRDCHRNGTGPLFSTNDIDAWLARAHAKRRSAPQRAFELDFNDDRWFWVSETTYDGGWMLLTCVDITVLKANERVLMQARDAALLSAETDVLTGLYNRRYIMARLAEAIEGARVDYTPLTLALIDLDQFKAINDGHGHDVGDQVLQHFAMMMKRSLRGSDLVARVGGEEFMVILPGATINDAISVLDRLRERVARSESVAGLPLRYSMSGGAAQFAGETPEALFRRADQALLQAKQRGRNRIQLATLDGTALAG